MMKLKDYKVIIIAYLFSVSAYSQFTITGKVVDDLTNEPIEEVEIYNQTTGSLVKTDALGNYIIEVISGEHKLVVFSYQYETETRTVNVSQNMTIDFRLRNFQEELSEVVITQKREEFFKLSRLKQVEGTAIYAGKKTEVVLVDQLLGNMAANNARQIYSQVVGLNIYESNDAGLQLNIGGRGLDPNRSSNFNTRQNNYDISADVLGYPESYYTPPAEALSEIQVIRGAASLQYGTQFGGLVNFKMKKPNPNKKLELVTRQTLGSFNLFTSFNSLSGSLGKFSYYAYFNYKEGEGFRPNSHFNSKNVFANFNYDFNDKTKLSVDVTHLHYLAKQPGGLTDLQFYSDPKFSNRTRNWFEVDWNLISARLEHKLTKNTDFSLNVFGLKASRKALGFRGNPDRPAEANPFLDEDEVDTNGNFVYPRDLLIGDFKNWGAETRFLTRYQLKNQLSVLLLGAKFYKANNASIQGPGSTSSNADFSLREDEFPEYFNRSDFKFPNLNLSVFGENIFKLNKKLSVTPGFRFEYIKTESEGIYNNIIEFDLAGNPTAIETLEDNRVFDRHFVLLGVGTSYKANSDLEVYGNISQNYRSVTFSDIRTVSPTFIIDPDISDEKGFTADLGFRGNLKNKLSYDIGVFSLFYNDRIGIILDDRANRVRTNIGNALIYGVEFFTDWDINKTFFDNNDYKLNWFVNAAFTESEYTKSIQNNVEGRKVEFIPQVNLKTGLGFGYKNLLGSIQYTYLSEQFTDAQNNPGSIDNVISSEGSIPKYDILDVSLSYTYKKFKLETGVNNALDKNYFTRRATGYPGPGIIPSEPRTFYTTLQFKF